MNHLNCILIEGKVCFEPKAVHTSSKTSAELVIIRLASNRFYTNFENQKTQDTLFIDVEAWGKLGKKALEYIQKGMTIRVVGRIRMSEWKTQDDKTREKILIVAEHIEFKRLTKVNSKENTLVEEEIVINSEKDESVCENAFVYEY